MQFKILGTPIAQQRHRDTFRNGKRCKYDPLSRDKEFFRRALQQRLNILKISKDQEEAQEAEDILEYDYYEVSLHFYFAPNVSDSLYDKNRKLWNFQCCDVNKDLDNLEKFVLDCMQGIAFLDDRKVTTLYSIKKYGDEPMTKIFIKGYNMKKHLANEILSLLSPIQLEDLKEICQRISKLQAIIDFNAHDDFYEMAECLSELAEMTANYLPKIKKKYPDYYKLGEVGCNDD